MIDNPITREPFLLPRMPTPPATPPARTDPGRPADAPHTRPAARLRQRRRQRVQMLGMVLASYAVDTVLMAALAFVGVLEPLVPWAYAGAGLAACGLFFTLLSGDWSERHNEHYLVIPQMLVNAAINLAFIAWVPQVGGLLLMVLFVIFAFGSLRMSLRSVLVGSLLISLLAGAVIALVGERIALPMADLPERAITGLWFALVLARSALLGLYGSELRALLAKRNAQLAESSEKLERLAHRDDLTGALNRRSVMRLLDEELGRMRRTGQPFGVAMLDIDHFKQVNDRHGHPVGDDVLRRFTVKVAAEMRNTDRLGRCGGEEFLLLLTAATDIEAATAAVDRMRNAAAREDWDEVAFGLDVTFSAGVAMCRESDTVDTLLARIDRALYRAKREGRNCVRAG
jgi:diguanylate cyclase (GGDEF)-like protein